MSSVASNVNPTRWGKREEATLDRPAAIACPYGDLISWRCTSRKLTEPSGIKGGVARRSSQATHGGDLPRDTWLSLPEEQAPIKD
jgi:hypothetical protein